MSGRRHVLSDDTLSKNRRIEQILPVDMMFPQAGFFRVPGKALNKKKEEPSWRLLKEERKIYLKKSKCLGEGQQSQRIRNSFQLLSSSSLKMFIV